MTTPDEHRKFAEWARDWQADAPHQATTAGEIRRYVKRRSGLMWSFVITDCVIVSIALPILVYSAVVARDQVEQLTMSSLALITIATAVFSWWNWRGVLRASSSSVADYIEVSRERIRRMRFAARVAWIVLIAELIVFSIWIRNRLYFSGVPTSKSEEFFAWAWLIGFALAFIAGLIAVGRWQARDAVRFEALRQELEGSVDDCRLM
jgi:hypothetical protein